MFEAGDSTIAMLAFENLAIIPWPNDNNKPPVTDNPLVISILELLKSHAKPISEYDLLKRLEEDEQHFSGLAESSQLALFQKHFLIMNALYGLQLALLEEGFFLHVSALSIHLQALKQAEGRQLSADDDAELRAYYLDWQNFEQADDKAVETLLNQFWGRYLAQDKQVDSYQCLGLEPGAEWPEVQASYRRLAAAHHPDRGGDAAEFIEIREAYEVLQATLGSA